MKKRKINLFDVVVIALVLVIAVAWYALGRRPAANTLEIGDEVTYYVELTQLKAGFSDLINPGDELIEDAENHSIGTVLTVDAEPQTNIVANQEKGVYQQVEVPDEERVVLCIKSEASESDSEILLDGAYVLRTGTSIVISGPGYKASGAVLQIEREGGGDVESD